MVHRVAALQRHGPAAGYVLTFGDNCLVPDFPVREERLLGEIVAVQTVAGWHPPGPPGMRSFRHQIVRGLTRVAMKFTLRFSVPLTRRVGATFGALQRFFA